MSVQVRIPSLWAAAALELDCISVRDIKNMSGEEENNPAPNVAQTDEGSADSEKQSSQEDNTGKSFQQGLKKWQLNLFVTYCDYF